MTTALQKDTSGTVAESTRQVNYIRPYYEVDEGEDSYEIRVFLPGVNKGGVDLSLEGDTLEITGTRTQKTPETWKIIRREQQIEDYQLQLQLNVKIDGGKISAKIDDGVLSLNLPKAEEIKPKTITIN